jgi:DNA-binding beta-propeller fold protein YncE
VADTGKHRIQKFDISGTGMTDVWGTYGTGDGQFDSPAGVAVDSEGKVYVADKGNHRIQEFRYQAPPAPPTQPVLGTLTPSMVASAENEAQSFSAVYSDENGHRDLKHVYLKVGSLVNGMVAIYYTWLNKLYLVNDAGTGYVGNCTPGVAGTLTNTQGTLDCGLTTVSGAGNDLTVNWSITPKAGYAGTKSLHMFARDNDDLTVGWEDKGDWTIGP